MSIVKTIRRLFIRIYKDPNGMYYSSINTTFRGTKQEVIKQIREFLAEPL